MLYGNEGQRVRDIIRKICADLEVDIVAGNVRLDHVHLLVSVPPQVSVSKLMQMLKGVSSRKLLQESARFKKNAGVVTYGQEDILQLVQAMLLTMS